MAGSFVRLGLNVVTQDDGDFLDVILLEHVVAQLVEATALQAGKSRVRFPMVSLEFFIDIILALGLTQPLTEMSTRNNSWG